MTHPSEISMEQLLREQRDNTINVLRIGTPWCDLPLHDIHVILQRARAVIIPGGEICVPYPQPFAKQWFSRYKDGSIWTEESVVNALQASGFADIRSQYSEGTITARRIKQPDGTQYVPIAVIKHELEPIHGKQAYEELGYAPEVYWTEGHADPKPSEEIVEWYAPKDIPQDVADPFVHSLRSNWINMLESAPENVKLFAESDAVPLISSRELMEFCEKTCKENKDITVLKPFHITTATLLPPSELIDKSVEPISKYSLIDRPTFRVENYGTHILYIPTMEARRKVAELFRRYAIPVDQTLEFAATRPELGVNTYRSSRDMFGYTILPHEHWYVGNQRKWRNNNAEN
ncbi:MAG: hypothetical protein RR382_00195 [Tannerellaceae bacterium]